MDKWNLIPGDPWQPAIEEALQKAESCAVFVGHGGLGSWQTEEMRAAINRRVTESNKRFRVIPVLLPGVEQPERSSLPAFLVAATWVEFHDSIDDQDAFHRLVCGIRGRTPGPGPGRLDPLGTPRTIHNLPFLPNPLFTGREAELEALRRGLQERVKMPVIKTVVAHGLGGVGKTQLVVQYAWKHLREFDAVFWMKADSPEALDASLAAIAPVLRLPQANEREQAIQIKAVLDWLNDHERWLLIADNADTDAAARAVRERLPPSLPCALLITSRISEWPVKSRTLHLTSFPQTMQRATCSIGSPKEGTTPGTKWPRGILQRSWASCLWL